MTRGRERRAAIFAAALAFVAPACTKKAEKVAPDGPPTSSGVTEQRHIEPVVVEPTTPLARLDRCEGVPAPLPAPRTFAACDGTRTTEKLTLLHVGDMHGHFHPYLSNSRSPFAVLRGYADRKRAETGERVLFVDAGDDLEKGSLIELRSRGDATVHLLDRLGLDARTLGNHDFAWDEQSVRKQVASPSHAVLASNIKDLGAKRTAVFEVGCVRVGVFGIVINGYDETDERVDAPYLGAYAQEHDEGDADRYIGVATALVRELREEQKVDVVVAVNHLGLARDRAIADAVQGIDLIVSAHDHQPLASYVQGKYAPMVSTGSFLGGKGDARVGETTLEIDLKTRAVRLTSATSSKVDDLTDLDESVQGEVERLQRCFAPDADTTIAELESPLGPAQLDAVNDLLDAALRAKFPEASALLYESYSYGGIVRGELARGPITPQMLADFAFSERQRSGGPGFTAFVPIALKGSELREICNAKLRDGSGKSIHRVCPAELDDQTSYTLVIERRPLYAPQLAFVSPPKLPEANDEHAVEAMDVLIDYAKARGKL